MQTFFIYFSPSVDGISSDEKKQQVSFLRKMKSMKLSECVLGHFCDNGFVNFSLNLMSDYVKSMAEI